MRRKFAILITVMLLLSGAAVFYFQLRKNALPEFAQVDQFLRQIPTSSNWELKRTDKGIYTTFSGPLWLQQMGYPRISKLPWDRYDFIDPRAGSVVAVIVVHDSQRITDLTVGTARSENAEIFRRHLLEKFPQLERVLLVNP